MGRLVVLVLLVLLLVRCCVVVVVRGGRRRRRGGRGPENAVSGDIDPVDDERAAAFAALCALARVCLYVGCVEC